MKLSSLLLKGEQAILFQFILLPLAMSGGLIYSPLNLNHPCWIVLAFLGANIALHSGSYLYYNSFDVDVRGMKTNMLVGLLKLSAGSLLITGAIMSSSWL